MLKLVGFLPGQPSLIRCGDEARRQKRSHESLDRKQQEEFFQDYLTRILPQGRSVHIAESSYEEERSAVRYRTSAGALVVCINDIEKPETDGPTALASSRAC
jgi:hypothetical protein